MKSSDVFKQSDALNRATNIYGREQSWKAQMKW